MARRPPAIDYQTFVESTPLVPWEYDARVARLVYVGPQAPALLGYPIEEWLDPSFWSRHVLPDDQAAVVEARSRLLREGGSHTIEFRMEHARGHLLWVSETATRGSGTGGIVRLRGLLGDVTERRRREEALAEVGERLKALVRSAPDALVFTRADGTIVNMNDQAVFLLGYELPEIRGSSIDLLVPDEARARFVELRSALHRDPERRTLVDGQALDVQRSDGERVPVEISVSVVPLQGERQLLYAIHDVTARRRLDERLHESEARLRGMADALPDLVAFVGADRRYRFVNEAYAKWFDRRPGDMEGQRVEDVLGPALYEQVRASIDVALSGVVVRFRGTSDIAGAIHNGGAADVTYVPQREGEAVTGYFVVVRDAAGSVGEHSLGSTRRGA